MQGGAGRVCGVQRGQRAASNRLRGAPFSFNELRGPVHIVERNKTLQNVRACMCHGSPHSTSTAKVATSSLHFKIKPFC
jgi:hypothetical protein